jgi:hypothetical protein
MAQGSMVKTTPTVSKVTPPAGTKRDKMEEEEEEEEEEEWLVSCYSKRKVHMMY